MHCQNALSVFFCSEEGNLRVKVSGLRQLSGGIFGLFHIYIHIPGFHSSATTYHTDFLKKYTSYISSRTKNFKVKNLNSKLSAGACFPH